MVPPLCVFHNLLSDNRVVHLLHTLEIQHVVLLQSNEKVRLVHRPPRSNLEQVIIRFDAQLERAIITLIVVEHTISGVTEERNWRIFLGRFADLSRVAGTAKRGRLVVDVGQYDSDLGGNGRLRLWC